MDVLRTSSITYRIATGKHAGRNVIPCRPCPGDEGPQEEGAGKVGGFSLHAEAHEGAKLERLCRYIARPAISEKRLSISPQGRGATGPHMWNGIQWISSPNWRRWSRRPAPGFTASLPRTRTCARS